MFPFLYPWQYLAGGAQGGGVWRVGAPCGAALPLLSSPHCSGRAELLRSFELASDAIVPISFLCLVTAVSLFLSWGLG